MEMKNRDVYIVDGARPIFKRRKLVNFSIGFYGQCRQRIVRPLFLFATEINEVVIVV